MVSSQKRASSQIIPIIGTIINKIVQPLLPTSWSLLTLTESDGMKIKIEYRVVKAPILPANLKSTDRSITINIKPIKIEKRLKSQNSLIDSQTRSKENEIRCLTINRLDHKFLIVKWNISDLGPWETNTRGHSLKRNKHSF